MGVGAQLSVTDLRRATRHPVDHPVIGEHRLLGDVHLHIMNLSAHGFMVEGEVELSKGERGNHSPPRDWPDRGASHLGC